MQLFATIIIFVSVLGCCLIVALVWLFHKYRSVQVANAAASDDLPPTRKLTIVRGRVIETTKAIAPSLRSGWTSLRSSVRRVPSNLGVAEKQTATRGQGATSRLSTVVWSPEEDLEKGRETMPATSEKQVALLEPGEVALTPQISLVVPRLLERSDDYIPSSSPNLLRLSIIDCLESAQSPDMLPFSTTSLETSFCPAPGSLGTRARIPLQSKFQLQSNSSPIALLAAEEPPALNPQ